MPGAAPKARRRRRAQWAILAIYLMAVSVPGLLARGAPGRTITQAQRQLDCGGGTEEKMAQQLSDTLRAVAAQETCFTGEEVEACIANTLRPSPECACSEACATALAEVALECLEQVWTSFCEEDPDEAAAEQMSSFLLSCAPSRGVFSPSSCRSAPVAPPAATPAGVGAGNGSAECRSSSGEDTLLQLSSLLGVGGEAFSCLPRLQDIGDCVPYMGAPAGCRCGQACSSKLAEVSDACMAKATVNLCNDTGTASEGGRLYKTFMGNCAPYLSDLLDCTNATRFLQSLPDASGEGGGGSSSNVGKITGVVLAMVGGGLATAVIIHLVRRYRMTRTSSVLRSSKHEVVFSDGHLAVVPSSAATSQKTSEACMEPAAHGRVRRRLRMAIRLGARKSDDQPRKLLLDLKAHADNLSRDPESNNFALEALRSLANLDCELNVPRRSAELVEALPATISGECPIMPASPEDDADDAELELPAPPSAFDSSVAAHCGSAAGNGNSDKGSAAGASDHSGGSSGSGGAVAPLQRSTRRHGSIGRRLRVDPSQRSSSTYTRFGFNTVSLITQLMPELPEVELNVDVERDIEFKAAIGQGAFGSVYMGIWTARDGSKRPVAVKLMRSSSLMAGPQKERILRTFSSELSIMARIDHPHVVRCYGGCIRDDIACLLLEFMEGGSLDKYLYEVRKDDPLSYLEILCTARQISCALAYLHPLVVHADIKPANVLLDTYGNLKIADFGLSRMKVQTVLSQQIGGTMAYLAPEVIKQEGVTEKCDIFSLGVLIWEVMVNDQPWKDVVNFQVMHKVCMEDARPELPGNTPRELRNLITSCWNKDPCLRPSAHEVFHKAHMLVVAASNLE